MRILRDQIHTRGSILESNPDLLDLLDNFDDDSISCGGSESDIEGEIESSSEDGSISPIEETSTSSNEIPELDMNDMIELANNYLDNDQVLRLRFPVQLRLNSNNSGDGPSREEVYYAREVILHNERNEAVNDIVQNIAGRNEAVRRLSARYNEDVDNRYIQWNVNTVNNGNNGDQRSLWVRIFDSLSLTLFPIVLLRVIKSLLNLTSFSFDILDDTFDFIGTIQEAASSGDWGSNDGGMIDTTGNSTLIMKFGSIIMNELPQYRGNSTLIIFLTLVSFYLYTIAVSIFMITSVTFLLMCISMSVGKRLHSLNRFIVRLLRGSEGVI